ncbi:trp operon leader peptide [uncultured Streptomyces sp.]
MRRSGKRLPASVRDARRSATVVPMFAQTTQNWWWTAHPAAR